MNIPYWVTKSIDASNQLKLLNWRSGKSVVIFDENHPVNLLKNVDKLDGVSFHGYEDDISWLCSNDFLIGAGAGADAGAGAGAGAGADADADADADAVLHLILLPAGEACNLDCIYCYEDHAYSGRMDHKTADALLRLIKNQNKKRVDVEYFGGEPLLNLRFIEYFSDLLRRDGIDFSGSITTNGTLLTSVVLERLYAAGIKSFQITLDGPRGLHNKLRISKSENLDSFESVCNSIRLISASAYSDLRVVLRLNVNGESVGGDVLRQFMLLIKSMVSTDDRRFFIFPKLIGDYSKYNFKQNIEAVDLYCDKVESSVILGVIEKALIDEGYALADALLLIKSGGYSCYAGRGNSIVVTPDLVLRKCTVAINDPINIVGNIDLDGKLNFNKNIDLWTRDWADSGCQTCHAQNTCGGNSCPLINIKLNKKICPPIKSDGFATEKVISFLEKYIND